MLTPVIRVGLTGGIGSGKSEVSRMLREHGAVIIDSDRIAREVVEPGEPALAEIELRFGPGVLAPGGTLDRAGLAAIVFNDPDALADLNAIMLPRIAQRTAELVEHAARDGAEVIVHDMPLLVETAQHEHFDAIVVVHAPIEVRLQRLEERGLARADAEARIGAQASDEERVAVADIVLDNSGDLTDLAAHVDAVWVRLTGGAGHQPA